MDDASGLSDAEAALRLRRDGPNILPSASRRGLLALVWGALTQPMFLLLLTTAAFYALLGKLTDAGMLTLSVLVVGGLSVYQEQRTDGVLQALNDLSSSRSKVVRDGRPLRVASRELVRGDRLLVHEGDRLSADAYLLEATGLQVDESLRTGESVPLTKVAGGVGYDGQLFAGSLVVRGDGVAQVIRTGARTAVGEIHRSLAQLTRRPSRLQQELHTLVRRVAWLAAVTCMVAATVFALRDGSWTEGMLVGLTLAMSLIPEEFAVVWSVMLALGSWRLTRDHVLTRQAQAIETLGTTTVLCVDKTGTLTLNRMALVALGDAARTWRGSDGCAPHELLHPLICGALQACSASDIDPMDDAVRTLASSVGIAIGTDWQPGVRRGIRPGAPYVVHWWQIAGEREQAVALKGAAEAVLKLCGDESPQVRQLRTLADQWSESGLRVLAVAQGRAKQPGDDAALPANVKLVPLGVLGFLDPLRPEVPAAMAQCRSAGVRVVMITGDSPLTAQAIALQAGLTPPRQTQAVTGQILAKMDDEALRQCVRNTQFFARVDPEQKLRIVRALQAQGEVVAMTGDGVNDAPALKAADIGVAMGQRGTDVAREAASLVLLDDNFASLVEAVRAGRRIFANLRRALGYLFAVHVPIVGVALIPVMLGGPALLLPLHVVLLELLIDPACSLVFEADPAEPDSMTVPPRKPDDVLLPLASVAQAVGLGGLVFAGVALVQWLAQQYGASDQTLRTASLGSIVAGNLLLLALFRRIGRSHQPGNFMFDGILLGACAVWVILTSLPAVAGLFGLATLSWPWAVGVVMLTAWAVWRSSQADRVA